jgi:hypothetical protein
VYGTAIGRQEHMIAHLPSNRITAERDCGIAVEQARRIHVHTSMTAAVTVHFHRMCESHPTNEQDGYRDLPDLGQLLQGEMTSLSDQLIPHVSARYFQLMK